MLNSRAAVIRLVERELAAADLPHLAWYDVLWSLYRVPGRRLRAGDLADAVTISPSGLTRLVDRMEAAGAVERVAAAGDRRGVEIAVTDEGRRLLASMWRVYRRVLAEHVVGVLGEREAEAVRDALERVWDSAAAHA